MLPEIEIYDLQSFIDNRHLLSSLVTYLLNYFQVHKKMMSDLFERVKIWLDRPQDICIICLNINKARGGIMFVYIKQYQIQPKQWDLPFFSSHTRRIC